MRDTLPAKSMKKECGILNLDIKKGNGTHWTCWYKSDSTHCYYFDSYGLAPPVEFDRYIKMKFFYSTYNIQQQHLNICGHLCLAFLYECIVKNASVLEVLLQLKQIFAL